MKYYIVMIAFEGINENTGEGGILPFKTLAENRDKAVEKANIKIIELDAEDEGLYKNSLDDVLCLDIISNL